MRSARGMIAASAGVVLIACALAAWAWPNHAARAGVREIVASTHGSLSVDAFRALSARMTPAELAIARRHDPFVKQTPMDAVTPGWRNIDIDGRPNLGFDVSSPDEAKRINALLPTYGGVVEAARPFVIPTGTPERARAERCLTEAIYYEAATEPREGQEGVAQVVLNRVRDHTFPNSVCGVVFQGCQFSFICDGSMARTPIDWAWKRAEDVADHALNGYVATQVGTATHYHADYVMPDWSAARVKLVQIGKHIFYRWRGAAGDVKAFMQRYAGNEPSINEAAYKVNRFAGATALAQLKSNTEVVKASDGSTRVHSVIAAPTMAGRPKPDKDQVSKINDSLAKYEQSLDAAPPSVGMGGGGEIKLPPSTSLN
jgi:spore germination cell wall hydrolase CwlJ-like protein